MTIIPRISCNEKEKSWTVPTVICRRKEKETWLIGEEAYAATLLGEGVIVDKLLKMVRKEGTFYYRRDLLYRYGSIKDIFEKAVRLSF